MLKVIIPIHQELLELHYAKLLNNFGFFSGIKFLYFNFSLSVLNNITHYLSRVKPEYFSSEFCKFVKLSIVYGVVSHF